MGSMTDVMQSGAAGAVEAGNAVRKSGMQTAGRGDVALNSPEVMQGASAYTPAAGTSREQWRARREGERAMTCTEMIPAIGATVLVACEGLNVACTVADVKHSWGKARLLVRPLKGNGEMWVEMQRVTLAECRGAAIANAITERL